MISKKAIFSFVLSSFILTPVGFAKEIPVQARLFLGNTSADLSNVNDVTQPQGIKKIDAVYQYGVEITYPVLSYLDVGMRYTKHYVSNDEDPADPNTDYKVDIDQDSVLLLARVPLHKSEMFRIDAFAGVGGSNTVFKVKTASQDGELTRKAAEGWFDSPYAAAGLSFGVGYKWFYFVVEGGFEQNSINDFKRTGTVSSSIDSLNMSGSYFSIGIMMDGIPGTVN